MRTTFSAALSLSLLVFLLTAAWAQQPTPGQTATWRSAYAAFQRNCRAGDPARRAKAASLLGEHLIPGMHEIAAKRLVTLLRQELGRSKVSEEDVDVRVLEAVHGALRQIAEPGPVAWIVSIIENDREPWRVRSNLIQGLGVPNDEKVKQVLAKMTAHRDMRLRLAAVEKLSGLRLPGRTDLLLTALDDAAWQVRSAAAMGLGRIHIPSDEEKERILSALVETLRREEENGGRLKWEVEDALKNITGDDPGSGIAAWEGWLARHRRGRPGAGNFADTRAKLPTYHGIRILSTRVVFVLDITGSMADPATKTPVGPGAQTRQPMPIPPVATGGRPTPLDAKTQRELEALREENDQRVVRTKMDAEKRELINAVLLLPRRVRFTIVFYAEVPQLWRDHLVPATGANKIDAVKEIEKMGPLGGTNIYQAILAAMRIYGAPAPAGPRSGRGVQVTGKSPLDQTDCPVDEIFLLTDGCPTVGRITDPDQLRREIRKINRVRKIRIHTVAVGTPGQGMSPVDLDFMKGLAQDNGGRHVHVK